MREDFAYSAQPGPKGDPTDFLFLDPKMNG